MDGLSKWSHGRSECIGQHPIDADCFRWLGTVSALLAFNSRYSRQFSQQVLSGSSTSMLVLALACCNAAYLASHRTSGPSRACLIQEIRGIVAWG